MQLHMAPRTAHNFSIATVVQQRCQAAHLALAHLGLLQEAKAGGVSIDQAWNTCMHLQTSCNHAAYMP